MANRFLEAAQICEGFLPIDMSLGANDGDWVSLKSFQKLLVVFFKDAGTAAEDPTLTMEQATDVAGTGAKALNFTKLWVKQAATNLRTTAKFTEVTQAAAATYTNGTLGEEPAIIVVEFDADDLDVDGGFDCVRARVADTGTTAGAMGCILYFGMGARYPQALTEGMIAD